MPDPMLQFFGYGHLPDHLKDISQPFSVLAEQIVATLPRNPERTVALRKLLEAKDCAVRALLYQADDSAEAEAQRHADAGVPMPVGPTPT